MTIRAYFDGKVFVPDAPVDLAPGRAVEIDVRPTNGSAHVFSRDRLLKVISEGPHIPKEDVDEMERLIEEGKLPVRDHGVFDNDPADGE